MTWTTIHLEVTTPLFNAGAGGGTSELRIPSLRGALRFWLRALVGMSVGLDLQRLACAEAAVFGRAADGSGDTSASSPVRLRLAQPVRAITETRPSWVRFTEGNEWLVYLLGQGLTSFRNGPISRPFVPPGTPVRLQWRCTGPAEAGALSLAALWLLCAYGGVGARTRRGLGGLRITGVEGPLPAPWTPETLRSPDLSHYEALTRIVPTEQVGWSLVGLRTLLDQAVGADGWGERLPTYPVLHKIHTLARTARLTFKSWEHVAHWTGGQWRHFRATQSYPGARYKPKIKTPEWEASIVGPGTDFGLGALGLPIVYKEGRVVSADRNGTELRRASPLWLRPVGAGDQWRLLSFAFLGKFLPTDDDPGLRVVLRERGRPGKQLTVTDEDVRARSEHWISTLRAGGSFAP